MSLIVFVDNNQIEVQNADFCILNEDKTISLYSNNGIILHKVGEFYDCVGVVDKNSLIGVKNALS